VDYLHQSLGKPAQTQNVDCRNNMSNSVDIFVYKDGTVKDYN